MKKVILFISAILFSTFFYQQNIGINLLLFTIITIVFMAILNPNNLIIKTVVIKSICYLITGITVFLYASNIAIIANIVGFFTFIGSVSEHKSSIYINWVNGIYTTIVSFFANYYDRLQNEKEPTKKEKIDYIYWLKLIGIPLVAVLLFINLYRSGNPVFDELISEINFNFINFHWILLTALGYYLFYNIAHPIQIEPITADDLITGNNLQKNTLPKVSQKKLINEKQLGVVLLVVLNLLILFFLITDVMYLSEIHNMSAYELSKQVHNGVNALIFSNVLAIIIILYFFRGNLNFIQKNTDLKSATYVWIFLNLSVVLITIIKNIEYIVSFGFTYKRIGVLFFLFFTSVGLITTFTKVTKVKNLWFLFRKNFQIAFVILIISSTINWDKVITYYNINYSEQLDLDYIINLSDNNTFLLKDFAENNKITTVNKLEINKKHSKYVENLNDNSWQEMVYDNFKID